MGPSFLFLKKSYDKNGNMSEGVGCMALVDFIFHIDAHMVSLVHQYAK